MQRADSDIYQGLVRSSLNHLKLTRGLNDAFLAFSYLYLLSYLVSQEQLPSRLKGKIKEACAKQPENIAEELVSIAHSIEPELQFETGSINSILNLNSSSWGERSKWGNALGGVLDNLLHSDLFDSQEEISLTFSYALEYVVAQEPANFGARMTPRVVSKLISGLLKPKEGERIYDPACGTAGFLVSANRFANQNGKKQLPSIYGDEIDATTAFLAKLNLLINGVGSFEVKVRNSLHPQSRSGGEAATYDVVLSNPPFSVKAWRDPGINNEQDPRFAYGTPPDSNADFAFISHVIASLNDRGRAGLVVSNGVLFRGGKEKEIRENIVRATLISTVIALPGNLFFHTSIPTNIILLSRNKSSHVLFVNLRDQSNVDISSESTLGLIKDRRETPEISRLATIEEIEANSFDLSPSRYVTPRPKVGGEEPVDELVREYESLHNELERLQEEMTSFINRNQ